MTPNPFMHLAEFLSQRTDRRRGRTERESVRSEGRRRYEAQRKTEADRYVERMTMDKAGHRFRAQQAEAAMPAEQAIEARPSLLDYMEKLTGETAEGTLQPAMPTVEQVQLMRTLGEPRATVGEMPTAAPGTLPTGTAEDVEYGGVLPPTEPGMAALYGRMGRERERESEKTRRGSGRAAAGHLRDVLTADPTGEGTRYIYLMDTEGAPPPDEDKVAEAAARGRKAIQEQRIREKRAGRSVRERLPESASRRLTPALKRGDRRGAVQAYMSVHPGASQDEGDQNFDATQDQNKEDALAKASGRAGNKRFDNWKRDIRDLDKQLAATYDPRKRADIERKQATLYRSVRAADLALDMAGVPKRWQEEVDKEMNQGTATSSGTTRIMKLLSEAGSPKAARAMILDAQSMPAWKELPPVIKKFLPRVAAMTTKQRRRLLSRWLPDEGSGALTPQDQWESEAAVLLGKDLLARVPTMSDAALVASLSAEGFDPNLQRVADKLLALTPEDRKAMIERIGAWGG